MPMSFDQRRREKEWMKPVLLEDQNTRSRKEEKETKKANVEEIPKKKATSTFKLALDIKTTIDIRKILELRILYRKVDPTLDIVRICEERIL